MTSMTSTTAGCTKEIAKKVLVDKGFNCSYTPSGSVTNKLCEKYRQIIFFVDNKTAY